MSEAASIPFYPDTIPIVLSSDMNYVPYLSTTIQSIVENASLNRKYTFYVFHKEIDDVTISIINNQISSYKQFLIEFINISEYIYKYNFFTSRHITVETYFRLLIPELLYEYQKVIYLDCDMIVCTDIAELYDIDIGNNLVAAMHDIDVANLYYDFKLVNNNKYRASLSILKNPKNYFCAGLCVFNIQLFRNKIPQEKLFELALSKKWDFHDQDVLNILTEGNVFLLSFHWGFYNTTISKNMPENLKNDYIDAENNAKIIHFIRKPWKYDFYIFHFEQFWKYATRTPFINNIVNQMNIPRDTSLKKKVIFNITQKNGIGLKFILIDCIKAWIFRKRK